MTTFHRLRVWFLAIGLIHLAVPLHAAEIDRKYLLDDAHLVVSVNVQKALASPAYQKHYQNQVEQLVKADVVQAVVKDLGFDPLKDVDRVTLVMGLSCYKSEPQMVNGEIVGFDSQSGPYFVVQGRFDAAKLEAKARQFINDLKVHEVGAAKVYESPGQLRQPMFAALVDAKTLVIAGFKQQVVDAVEKAAGKKKTQLIDKVMIGLLDKLDVDQPLAVAASGQMVVGTSTSVSNNNGQVVATVQHRILKEQVGIDGLLGHIRVADDVKGGVTLTVADAEKAKEMATMIELGVQKMIEKVKKEIERPNSQVPAKMLAPSLKFLQALKVTSQDRSVELRGEATAEATAELVKSWFLLRTASSARAPALAPDDDN